MSHCMHGLSGIYLSVSAIAKEKKRGYHESIPTKRERAESAIGKFDGRHRGHQKLLKTMLKIKEEYGYKTAVFTFSIAPADLVQGKRHTVITTNLERKNNLGKMGMDYLVEYPFTQAASQMSAEDFVKNILTQIFYVSG